MARSTERKKQANAKGTDTRYRSDNRTHSDRDALIILKYLQQATLLSPGFSTFHLVYLVTRIHLRNCHERERKRERLSCIGNESHGDRLGHVKISSHSVRRPCYASRTSGTGSFVCQDFLLHHLATRGAEIAMSAIPPGKDTTLGR